MRTRWVAAAVALMVGLLGGASAATAAELSIRLNPVGGSGVSGTATLVTTPASATLTVRLTGLRASGVYRFHVHETKKTTTPCAPGAGVEGTPVHGGWNFPAIVADAAGAGVGVATAARFALHTDETYWVDVHTDAGVPVACGVLSVMR